MFLTYIAHKINKKNPTFVLKSHVQSCSELPYFYILQHKENLIYLIG